MSKADGEKQAAILEADGRLAASKRDAEAQIVLANASKKAITLVAEAVDGELPIAYLLGEKYTAAMENLASSSNTKTFVLPADLLNTVKGILGK